MTTPRCHTYAEQVRERNPIAYERARLVVDVTNQLEIALEEQGLTQADLARRLGRSRSIVSRQLSGAANLSLGKLAELAFAIGKRFEFTLSNVQEARSLHRLRLMSSQPESTREVKVNMGATTLRPSRANRQDGVAPETDALTRPQGPGKTKTTKHTVAA